MSELAFWSPFSLDGFLARLRYRRKCLGPASKTSARLVDSLWEELPTLRSGWGGVKMARVRGVEEVGTVIHT